jgi:hypothetical protein
MERLQMVSNRRWTVLVERELDGIRIAKRIAGLTAGEAFVLKFEEQMLPGELIRFERRPYEHGDLNEDAVQSVDGNHDVFDLLRKSFSNDLTKEKA